MRTYYRIAQALMPAFFGARRLPFPLSFDYFFFLPVAGAFGFTNVVFTDAPS
jgi:hypothetical protein